MAKGRTHMFSSIVDQSKLFHLIKFCIGITIPSHWCYAQHSGYARNEGSEDRKVSSQNKGTKFKGSFNRSVYKNVNLNGKRKLQLYKFEPKPKSLECSTHQRIQSDGSWNQSWLIRLRATTPIGLQDRNTNWNFRRSKEGKYLSFCLRRNRESGCE